MSSIEEKIRQKLDAIMSQRANLQKQIESLQSKLDACNAQRSLLMEIMSESDSSICFSTSSGGTMCFESKLNNETKGLVTALTSSWAMDQRPRAAAAVLNLLRQHKEGLALKDITTALAGKIATESANPDNVVRNTALNLVARKRLVRDDATGVFFLNESGS